MEVKNLRSYLANVGISMREFSDKLDYNPDYISSVAAGRAIPSKRLARDIFHATSGIVNLSTRPKREKIPTDIKSKDESNQP